MPIQIALNTQCGSEPLEIIRHARPWGFDGVELDRAAVERLGSDTAALKSALESGGAAPAVLQARSTSSLMADLDLAAALGFGLVRVSDDILDIRPSFDASVQGLADRLRAWGDQAEDRGLTLLLANGQAMRTPRQLWLLLEMADHPAVTGSWDLAAGTICGVSPAVAIPTLSAHLGHATLADLQIDGSTAAWRPLGEGQAQVKDAIIRLRGIGHDGWVTVGALAGEGTLDAIATAEATRLRSWIEPPREEPKKPPHKPAPKAVAR